MFHLETEQYSKVYNCAIVPQITADEELLVGGFSISLSSSIDILHVIPRLLYPLSHDGTRDRPYQAVHAIHSGTKCTRIRSLVNPPCNTLVKALSSQVARFRLTKKDNIAKCRTRLYRADRHRLRGHCLSWKLHGEGVARRGQWLSDQTNVKRHVDGWEEGVFLLSCKKCSRDYFKFANSIQTVSPLLRVSSIIYPSERSVQDEVTAYVLSRTIHGLQHIGHLSIP